MIFIADVLKAMDTVVEDDIYNISLPRFVLSVLIIIVIIIRH